MVILGDKKVEVITSERMLKEFGSFTACALKNGVLYINREALESEKRKLGKYLSTEEIIEDFYRDARRLIMKQVKRRYSTIWDRISETNIDSRKYRKPVIL